MDKLFILVLVALFSIVCALNNDNIDIHVNVDPDSKAYHQFKTREGSFNYGYNVAKKMFNQFQHKVRGPDDVTYGCYGFVDPENGTHLYHYVSDLKGYRVVAPNKTTKIYRQRVTDSVKQLLNAVEESIPWERLYFPEVCRHLYISQKESNQFSIPEGYVVDDYGSLVSSTPKPKVVTPAPPVSVTIPRVVPVTVKAPARLTPPPLATSKPAARRTAAPQTPAPPRNNNNNNFNVPSGSVTIFQGSTPLRVSPTTPRPTQLSPVSPAAQSPSFVQIAPSAPFGSPVSQATTPRSTRVPLGTPAPRFPVNDYPSKIVQKPIEIVPNLKPGVVSRRPQDNNILNLATTQSETVLIPKDLDNQVDLVAIGQDIQEVKATLKKLFQHILSRNADCNVPAAAAPPPPSYDQRVVPGAGPTAGGSQVTAFLPLIVTDFYPGAGAPLSTGAPVDLRVGGVPSSPAVPAAGHPLGALKLALPAYPASAYHAAPQCPVCRSDSGKK
ncbi:helicase SRCAP isoform X1 [Culex quinquefasciatus]|uniref:helicase SRCAP isoform X1 n=1 Tax=Culex quinquefasciatus TaxID=7176 RepID=UPI0018E3153C|nr:helicase SRCAP isoform X1 [Culex quinquefasciatus]